MSNTYKDLLVWQRAIDLIEIVYRLTQRFPRDERWGLISQLRRASVSIASNIAEGQGRSTHGEFRQFVGHARGSTLEVETQLIIAVRLGLLTNDSCSKAFDLCDQIKRMLHGLAASLETKETTVAAN